MNLTNKNILVISPEGWGKNFVSKHHYAVTLAKRENQVFFVGPPEGNFSCRESGFERVNVLGYPSFPPGFRFYPKPVRRMLQRRWLAKLEQVAGVPFDILWSFDNSVFFDLDSWKEHKYTISHIVDLNQDFETARAARSANICFCTTELIKDRLIRYNLNTHKIPHGYTPATVAPQPKTLPGAENPKVIYVGNLSMAYIDWSLIHSLVCQNPTVGFVFLGPEGKSNLGKADAIIPDKESVKKSPNSYFVGECAAQEVMGYLLAADACLVAYQEAHHQDQASPHKIAEYLASGKAVIATYTAEYKDSDVLLMTRHNEDFPDYFQGVIQEIDEHNSPEASQKRRSYIMDRTYSNLIKQIEKHIRDPQHT